MSEIKAEHFSLTFKLAQATYMNVRWIDTRSRKTVENSEKRYIAKVMMM